MKRSYKELYYLIGRMPGYTKGEDGEKILQGIIWGHTRERVYHKSEMTDDEYDSLCAWLRAELGIKKRRSIPKSDCVMDRWRKRVIAVLHEYASYQEFSKSSAYRQNSVSYVKSIACRVNNSDDFDKITLEQLRTLYMGFCKKNEMLKKIKEID